MKIKSTIIAKNEDETRKLGLELGRRAEPGQIIALIGDLGTGKTTLTKYIAEGLGITEVVSSPTFTFRTDMVAIPLLIISCKMLDCSNHTFRLYS